MYIDLRPEDPSSGPDASPRDDAAAAVATNDSPDLPLPARGEARGAVDEERPSLRTLRIFRVLMDD